LVDGDGSPFSARAAETVNSNAVLIHRANLAIESARLTVHRRGFGVQL